MKILPTGIAGVVTIEPVMHGDSRGYFLETWRAETFATAAPGVAFVQDNQSSSYRGVLRGLHYQIRQPQGKLVRVISGRVFDVAVDLRRSSPTCGRWAAAELSAENHRQMWIPPGCAHGFYVLSEQAEFVYKCSDYYAPEHERVIRWDDPTIGVDWPLTPDVETVLSDKDRAGVSWAEAELFD